MENDEHLLQQGKESIRVFEKAYNDLSEDRRLSSGKYNPFITNGKIDALILRAEELRTDALNSVGIPASRMGSGLSQQLKQGGFTMQKSRGLGNANTQDQLAMMSDNWLKSSARPRSSSVGVDTYSEPEVPETIEELKSQLNPDLLGSILALEKR